MFLQAGSGWASAGTLIIIMLLFMANYPNLFKNSVILESNQIFADYEPAVIFRFTHPLIVL